MDSKAKQLTNLVWVNIKVLIIFIVLIEVAGQLIYFFNHHELRLSARPIPEHDVWRETFEKHPYFGARLIPGKSITAGKLKFSANQESLRVTGADQKDTNKIRVACVGGSTTYCSHISDEDSWPSRLQEKLGERFAVFNYGMLGYGTTEGILQSALLLPEINPDLVIFYEGWNDMKNYHDPDASPDYHAHATALIQSLACDDAELKCYNAWDAFRKFSGLAYLTQMTRNHAVNYLRKHGIHNFDHTFKSPGKVFNTIDPRIDKLYFRNLKTLRALALAHNATPLFIPQVMNPHFFLEGNPALPWNPYLGTNSLSSLMPHFNTVMDSMCSLYHCEEIKDIHKNYNWSEDCFIDVGHFSKKGANQFAEIVYQKIKQLNIEKNGFH